jgi:hypothetical protein
MDDELFGIGGDAKSGRFYSVQRDVSDLSYEVNGNLLTVNFVIDSIEDFYERKVYNFFDLTGQLGGLFEILTLFGSIFVTFFAEKILMLSLISNLYQVEDREDASNLPILTHNNTTRVMPLNSKIEERKERKERKEGKEEEEKEEIKVEEEKEEIKVEEEKTPSMERNKDGAAHADLTADDDGIDLYEDGKAL